MSYASQLLVASRNLRDPNFYRTVVLLLEHTEDGALGVVLNRPAERTIAEVWDSIEADPVDNDQTINQGGPVPGPLVGLHRSKSLSEKKILPGLYFAMQREKLDALVRQSKRPFRLYSGNAGWGGGQLEAELEAGGWLTAEARREDVFAPAEEIWDRVTRRIGLSILVPGLKPKDAPDDPSLN